MKRIINNYKFEIITSIILFIFTTIISHNLFQNKVPYETYLYPYENSLFLLKYIILKTISFFIIFIIIYFIKFIYQKIKEKNIFYIRFIEGSIIFFILLFITLLKNFPGVWTYDALHLLEYATSLNFISWHNIYTSIFYIISLFFIPHASGIVIIQFILISIIFGYIYAKIFEIFPTKLRFLIFLILTPINIFYANWVFRTTISSYLELFLIFFTIFNLNKKISFKKMLLFDILIAFICFYRSENIIYILLPIILNFKSFKIIFKHILFIIIISLIINFPQKIISNKYYNYDYLIITTYESLQYILNTVSANDKVILNEKNNIEKIIPYEYLKNYGQHSYFEYNYENNSYGTVLNKPKTAQLSYLLSVLKIFKEHFNLFLQNKINLTTSLFINKTYYPTTPLYSLRTKYFFEERLNSITNHIDKKYHLNKNIYNVDTTNSLLIPFSIICLALVFNLFKNKKLFLVLLLLFIKLGACILFAPGATFMYFYYLYLI